MIMGTLKGFASPSAPANPPCLPLAALGLAKPSRAVATPGKARLYLRDAGNLGGARATLGTRYPPPALRAALRTR
jgi:hypothetical protein